MARTEITVVEPTLEASKSAAHKNFTAETINTADGATIVGATGVKDNSLVIIVNATSGGTVTIKAGVYHNAVMGDLAIPCESGLNAIQIENPSRFQKNDGNIDIDFTSVAGTIYAIGKHAGLEAVE